MFAQKIETIKFSDFMDGSYKEKNKKEIKFSADVFERLAWLPVMGLATSVMAKVTPVFAASPESIPVGIVSGAVTNQVIHAFDPLVQLMISLSLPIASVILTGSALMILIGRKEVGYGMMMQASIGYVLVQMVPLFIKLLAGVGAAI